MPTTVTTTIQIATQTKLDNIILTDAGKRFNREWIYRHCNYQFEQGKTYAITGPNGSGKSTLLQAIAGSMQLSEGAIVWNNKNGSIEPEQIYKQLAITAPYLELVEEMSAKEFLEFHSQFKPLVADISIDEILSIIGLDKTANKQIRYFSSGMKQRVKLAQAIFSDVPILLLDEPCTNLDATGYALYHQLIENYCSNKLIVVSSNDKQEFDFCEEVLKIVDYK
ncbi:MAG: ABC transporter ATP-binding protein [Chitinophagaceae bacterium]|nr:ABC transporter ATP-binding protein [Chitinophagaceae bacterium]